jgi:hypothetical protein
MKLGMAICLCLSVGGSMLTAQQTMLAASGLSPLPFAVPATTSPVIVTSRPALFSALGDSGSIYDAAHVQSAVAVCTQAVPHATLLASDYAFDHLHFSSAAMKAAFSHDNMMKVARNFVPGQRLPDAPSYNPLTPRQKFAAFVRQSYSASLAVSVLSDALISQATGAYPRFGGGMKGFGQRLGVSAVGNEGAAFFGGFLYPTLFHQDPRYFPSRENSILNRLAYAASRALIGRSDNGFSVINSSVIASQFTEAAIANAYIPYRNRTFGGTAENALTGIAGVAEGNILKEFWPDIKEFVSRHTTNRWVRRGMAMGDPTTAQFYK